MDGQTHTRTHSRTDRVKTDKVLAHSPNEANIFLCIARYACSCRIFISVVLQHVNLVVLKECVLDMLAAPIVYPVTAPGLALDTIQSRLLKYVPGEISHTKWYLSFV